MSALARCGRSSGLMALLVAAACGSPSADEVKREFAEIVEESNACESAIECVRVDVACPLPCYAFVNRRSAERVRRHARELVEDYESGGTQCFAECVTPPEPACIDGRCAPAME